MYSFITPIPTQFRSIRSTSTVEHQHSYTSPPRRLRSTGSARSTRTTIPQRTHPSCNASSSSSKKDYDENQNEPKFTFNINDPPPDEETITNLIKSERKGDQQRGLLYIRKLPTLKALELYLLSLRTSTNDFIRATAAVGIGELNLSEAPVENRNSAISALIDLLATAEDYGVRGAAAAGMGYATGVANSDADSRTLMIEALSRALIEDSEWQVQFSCIASMGVLGKDNLAVIDILKPWLKDDNDLLIQAAVGALGDIGRVEALPDLLGVLGSKDMMTRQRIAQALGNIPNCNNEPAAIDALRTLAKDQSFVVRQTAKDGLKAFGVSDQSNQSDSQNNTEDSGVEELDELEQLVEELKDGFEILENGMRDENEDTSEQSKEEELLNKEVINLLNGDEAGDAEESASDALRRRLERSFSAEWSESKHPPLDPSDESGSFTYRDKMMANNGPKDTSLSQKGPTEKIEENNSESPTLSSDKKALAEVVKKIQSGPDKDRMLAAIELRNFEVSLALDAVLESKGLDIYNTPFRVRSLCIPILGRAGDINLLVQQLQNDPEENVRSTCVDALTEAIENGANSGEAIDACIHCLKEDDHWLVRISAAIALGSIGKGVEAVELALIDCMKSKSDLQAVQASTVKRHIITALGFVGSVRAVKLFEELLENQGQNGEFADPAMRYRVAAALNGIESNESAALVKKLVQDKDKFVVEMAQSTLDALQKKGFF